MSEKGKNENPTSAEILENIKCAEAMESFRYAEQLFKKFISEEFPKINKKNAKKINRAFHAGFARGGLYCMDKLVNGIQLGLSDQIGSEQ